MIPKQHFNSNIQKKVQSLHSNVYKSNFIAGQLKLLIRITHCKSLTSQVWISMFTKVDQPERSKYTSSKYFWSGLLFRAKRNWNNFLSGIENTYPYFKCECNVHKQLFNGFNWKWIGELCFKFIKYNTIHLIVFRQWYLLDFNTGIQVSKVF